ncbi:MAG: hypothetical protein HY533_00370 [Chloroflexi bacterium]|nr:hypothetical protein [Chloroflexota bacterium]
MNTATKSPVLLSEAKDGLSDFCDADGALRHEVRVNGVVIPIEDAKGYKACVTRCIYLLLQLGMDVSVGAELEPWDRVYLRGRGSEETG